MKSDVVFVIRNGEYSTVVCPLQYPIQKDRKNPRNNGFDSSHLYLFVFCTTAVAMYSCIIACLGARMDVDQLSYSLHQILW